MSTEERSEPEPSSSQSDPVATTGLNITSIFTTQSDTPGHVFTGLWSGVKNLALSTVGGVAALLVLPVKFGSDWYEKAGIVGGIGGGITGTVLGAVSFAGLVVVGSVSLLYHSINGLLRTPGAIYHGFQGKEWDVDAEEWLHYDLQIEASKLSKMTEEEFIKRISSQSTSSIYSTQPLPGEQSVDADKQPRAKKNVFDRELYDVLGIEPEATASEIKKAYYLKARQFHPDRNPGPEAKAVFQRIGQAYQVLGDDALRADYDMKGKAALEKTGTMDASMLYMIIFGSEQFEPLIGELQIAMIVRHIADTNAKPSAVMRFRQKKRELQCALALANKLDDFLTGDVQAFREKATKETNELTETLMGTLLLHYIGVTYIERGRRYIATLDFLASELMKPIRAINNSFSYCTGGCSAAYGAWELHGLHQEAEAMQQEDDKKNGVTEEERNLRKAQQAMNLNGFYGPNPTAERKKEVCRKIKKFSSNLLRLVWHFTKQDLRTTIKSACHKVLYDHSVLERSRTLRAQGMIILGEIYSSKNVGDEEGLDFLLERLGRQTGLFADDVDDVNGAEEKSEDDMVGDNDSDDSDVDNPLYRKYKEMPDGALKPSQRRDKAALMELKSRVETLSIKELKYHIEVLNGEWELYVEKNEMRQGLYERIDLILAEIAFNEER